MAEKASLLEVIQGGSMPSHNSTLLKVGNLNVPHPSHYWLLVDIEFNEGSELLRRDKRGFFSEPFCSAIRIGSLTGLRK